MAKRTMGYKSGLGMYDTVEDDDGLRMGGKFKRKAKNNEMLAQDIIDSII